MFSPLISFRKNLKFVLCLSLLFPAFVGYTQKKPLNHDVYNNWEKVGSTDMSRDGKWMLYNINPQEGDKTLYLQANENPKPDTEISRSENPSITYDSKFAVFLIKPFFKDIKRERLQKRKKKRVGKTKVDEVTEDSLGIFNLTTHNIQKIPEVKSYKLPEKKGRYLAYIQKQKITSIDSSRKDSTDKAKPKKRNKLVLLDLIDGKETTYLNADKYIFNEKGTQLTFTVKPPKKSKKEEKDSVSSDSLNTKGIYIVDTQTREVKKVIETKGDYSRLGFSKIGNKLAFIGTHDKKKKQIKNYKVYLYDVARGQIDSLDQSINGVPLDWTISENYSPNFSKDNEKLFVGIAPQKEPKDTTFAREEKADLDIWHYKDDYVQPQQLARRKRDLKKSYLSVIHLDQPNTLVQLQKEEMNYARKIDRGNNKYILAMSDKGHRIESQWKGSVPRSYYLIDTQTGKKTEVIKDLIGSVSISPKGKYIAFYDRVDENWYAYDVENGETKFLNKGLKVSFADEENDRPAYPRSYPLVGWTKNDKSVLIRDHYDIWEFSLDKNKSPRNITKSYGKKNKIKFSYHKLKKDQRSIARDSTIILQAFNKKNKESGYYSLKIAQKRKPRKLLMEPMSGHGSLQKAEKEDIYTFVHSSFEKAPSLVSTRDFKDLTKLHQTNPQQKDYNWGTVELIHYKTNSSKDGVGMLYKPEDFDKTKKYPMLLYFYEQKSDNLYGYEPPAPTPSRLNISFFVSNGYLVFIPDIKYTDGHPGRSAEDYIDSGVDYLKKKSWVDNEHIGIQGQSWGGYQVAHLITRSDRYAAAWAGAPVVNMTSAYGGIRWATGMNRQFQYEKTQSRIGKNLWDGLDLYMENSPLFYLENVTTPVAIMHNDKDGAVPWYQGIEMFTALRRLRKPVWLLNYNGDEHNLMKRRNRKDVQRRQKQFFDHYLKDEPAPKWMTEGIPATQKGKTWGFELTDNTP